MFWYNCLLNNCRISFKDIKFLFTETSVVIASDTNLSKMTALLISAGLWPPPAKQMWNDTVEWQPVPYTYPPRKEDLVSILYLFMANFSPSVRF